MIIIDRSTRRYYVGFSSLKGEPIFISIKGLSVCKLDESVSAVVVKQLKLLGYNPEVADDSFSFSDETR